MNYEQSNVISRPIESAHLSPLQVDLKQVAKQAQEGKVTETLIVCSDAGSPLRESPPAAQSQPLIYKSIQK